MPQKELTFIEPLFLVLAALAVRDSQRRFGNYYNLALAFFYGLVVEYCVYEQIDRYLPEGRLYDHSSGFVFMIPGTGIPFYIVLLWMIFLYVSHATCEYGFDFAKSNLHRWILLPIVACGLAASMDFTCEPVSNKYGFWVYRVNGKNELGSATWNGSPLVNLAAWFPLQMGYSLSFYVFTGRGGGGGGNAHAFFRQLGVGVCVCFAGFAAMGPARTLLASDVNLVLLLFAGSALVTLFETNNFKAVTTKKKRLLNDKFADIKGLLVIVLVWHLGFIVPLWMLPSDPSAGFTLDKKIELTLLGAISTAAFCLPLR